MNVKDAIRKAAEAFDGHESGEARMDATLKLADMVNDIDFPGLQTTFIMDTVQEQIDALHDVHEPESPGEKLEINKHLLILATWINSFGA